MTQDTRDLRSLLRLVRSIVGGFSRKVPTFIERDELLGAALLGLADALTKRPADDPRPFRPYAHTRIRGSIRDYLRSADPLTRDQRERARETDACSTWPQMPIAVGDFERIRSDEPSVDDLADELGKLRRLREAVARLPTQHRQVVRLRHQRVEFHNIGRRMGFTESRACQLYHEAVRMVGEDIGQQGEPE